MFDFIAKLFKETKPRNALNTSNHTSNATKISVEALSKNNKDVLSGYKLSVSMLSTVPLRLLIRHGEITTSIPASDSNLSSGDAVWLPVLAEKYSFLSEGRTMWSPVGHIPEDGAEVLEYLIAARKIIEAPLSQSSNVISEALLRVAAIKALPKGPRYTTNDEYLTIKSQEIEDYFPLFFGDEKKALSLLLIELKEPSHKGLSYEHILELHTKGFNSITEILSAPDEVLLSLNGIGKMKLEKIRSNT